jgi:hypothetical protein
LLLFRTLACAVALAIYFSSAMASTNLVIGDEVYDILERLEAEGIITSGLLTTRPITRMEAARLLEEAEKNSEGQGPFVTELIRMLGQEFDSERRAKYIKPFDKSYSEFAYSDQLRQEVNYNNDGIIYEDGFNLRLGLTSRAEMGWFSAYINPEIRSSEGDTDFVMMRAYGTITFLGLDFQLGQDSLWWGPGHHGALLISNNAPPLALAKLSNSKPKLLPWIFRKLGPFRFVFFAARLEEERSVPNPYLWGLRLNFKPSPYIEIGFSRTSMLGGAGHSEDPEAWVRSFFFLDRGGGEVSDHKVGFDIKITLPLKHQPGQIYGEIALEDGGLPAFVENIVGYEGRPPMTAYLVGLYVPRLFGIDKAALTAEYATTRADNRPEESWYTHHIYQTGHTYKGRILGHHMGAESEDFFLELSYLVPQLKGGVKMSYDWEKHYLEDGFRLTKDEVRVKVNLQFRDGMEVEGGIAVAKIATTTGGDEKGTLTTLKASYVY